MKESIESNLNLNGNYKLGRLCSILNGSMEEFTIGVESMKEIHQYLISYCARPSFKSNQIELRYLEILTCLAYFYKHTMTLDICKNIAHALPYLDVKIAE